MADVATKGSIGGKRIDVQHIKKEKFFLAKKIFLLPLQVILTTVIFTEKSALQYILWRIFFLYKLLFPKPVVQRFGRDAQLGGDFLFRCPIGQHFID